MKFIDIIKEGKLEDEEKKLKRAKTIFKFFSKNGPLIIKEISNSRKEIKLIKNFNDHQIKQDINVSVTNGQILLDGKNKITLKSGLIYNLNFTKQSNVNLVKFSR